MLLAPWIKYPNLPRRGQTVTGTEMIKPTVYPSIDANDFDKFTHPVRGQVNPAGVDYGYKLTTI
jgi:hypothetical protein